MKQIAPRLKAMTGTAVMAGRVYVIRDPDGLTLIDTGTPSASRQLLRQIKGSGRAVTTIKRILITHAHHDHIGSLPQLKALSGAQVISCAAEQPYIQGEIPSNVGNRMAEATPVDRLLEDGEVLPEVLDGLQAIFTPGHTPGHLAFWQPEQRILFCGDALFNLAGLRPAPGPFTVDVEEAKRSILRLAELEPAVLCCGHGPVVRKNAARRLQKLAQRLVG